MKLKIALILLIGLIPNVSATIITAQAGVRAARIAMVVSAEDIAPPRYFGDMSQVAPAQELANISRSLTDQLIPCPTYTNTASPLPINNIHQLNNHLRLAEQLDWKIKLLCLGVPYDPTWNDLDSTELGNLFISYRTVRVMQEMLERLDI